MNQYLFLLSALLLPVLVSPIRIHRKGFLTGLLIGLLYWCKVSPYFAVVPVSAAVITLISLPVQVTSISIKVSHPKRPATHLFIFFVISLAVFTAISTAVIPANLYYEWRNTYVFLSTDLSIIVSSAGAVFFGWLCDKKGSFISSLYLVFLSEVGICFSAARSYNMSAFALSVIMIYFCAGGFPVCLPMLSRWFWGRDIFYKLYPPMAAFIFFLICYVRKLCTGLPLSSSVFNEFLIGLLGLTVSAMVFLFVSWKRRLFLVMGSRDR
ncbi:MAG: hypothetical protein PUB87_00305 [Eubacteriaceae bacterium]|nr:hypothetical protein [Eubacteriaceae bacterium]